MTLSLMVLAAFILVLFGVLIGCRLSEKRLNAGTKRQAEIQRSLNSQWQELQEARRENHSARTNRCEPSPNVREPQWPPPADRQRSHADAPGRRVRYYHRRTTSLPKEPGTISLLKDDDR